MIVAVAVFATVACAGSSASAQKTPPPKKPVTNETKGQGQLAGVAGQFGTVYTLKTGFNFTVVSARYTLDPVVGNEPVYTDADSKLLVIRVTAKNALPTDNRFFVDPHAFTVVDTDNHNYESNNYSLKSQFGHDFNDTVRPGQGLGFDPDAFEVAFRIPAKARIVKFMLNQGRKGRDEEVVRYYIAGATKAEAGAEGDSKNVIAPLPPGVADPADKTGATALLPAKGKIGERLLSGAFSLRLDSITYSTTATYDNNPPEEDKKFAIVTVTAKYHGKGEGTFDEIASETVDEMTDNEGETAAFMGYRKVTRDEYPEKTFKLGEEYTYRLFFALPKNTKPKKLVLSATHAYPWAIDLSATP